MKLPTKHEIELAALQLAQESTAPDKETPDWMISDIKRGMVWMMQRMCPHDNERENEVGQVHCQDCKKLIGL
jgi:hypothetical protein